MGIINSFHLARNKERDRYCPLAFSIDKMWERYLDNIVGCSSRIEPNLADSLRPVFFGMRIFGVNLSVSSSRTHFRLSNISIFIFVAMESALLWDIWVICKPHNLRLPGSWKNLITEFKWLIWDCLFPPTMFYSFMFKWKYLWQKVNKMGNAIKYPTAFYRQLFTCSLALSGYVFIQVSFFSGLIL